MRKTIWMYWHQGFDIAPKLVQQCVLSWQKHHPDWDIKLLDAQTVTKHISPIPIAKDKLDLLKLAHRSDLIRTQLLIEYGGVWVDPTIFCAQSLNNWLPEKLNAGFFMFYKPGRDRIISNWFIAAKKDNPLVKKLLEELLMYWDKNTFLNLEKNTVWYENFIKRIYSQSFSTTQLWFTGFTRNYLKIYPYMVYHYKFYQLISKEKQFKDLWDKMPKISADGPHQIQRAGLLKPLNNEIKEMIDNVQFPLYKLTWRLKSDKIPRNSNLQYLFDLN